MRREVITAGTRRIGYLTSAPDRGVGPDPAHSGQRPLQTILFLHAFPLDADMWRPQIGAAPAGWRMVAPDYRGFGQSSSGGPPGATMNDLAGEVVDFLDRLDIHEAVVVGCSMGGYVAFELLASARNYVKGLVLVDTRAGADTEEGRAGRRKMLQALDAGGAAAIADAMMPKLLGETTKRERKDLATLVDQMIRGADPAAIRMAVNAMMERKDMTPLLRDIHVPTLVVAGAEDGLIPAQEILQMHEAIAASTLEIVPGAGHLPSMEQPAVFDAAMQRFLRQF